MRLGARLRFAASRPDLALRVLRGRPALEVELAELDPYVPSDAVILEAGAHSGGDTQDLATRWPTATIHAFEPLPAAYEQLRRRMADHPSVHCHPVALGSHNGTATFHVSAFSGSNEVPGSSSLLPPQDHREVFPHVTFPTTTQVPVRTLDDWAAEHEVTRIDVARLDMQGTELAMLQAAPRMERTMSVLLIEVCRRPLYRGAPLYPQVTAWLLGRGWQPVLDRTGRHYGNVLFVRPPR